MYCVLRFVFIGNDNTSASKYICFPLTFLQSDLNADLREAFHLTKSVWLSKFHGSKCLIVVWRKCHNLPSCFRKQTQQSGICQVHIWAILNVLLVQYDNSQECGRCVCHFLCDLVYSILELIVSWCNKLFSSTMLFMLAIVFHFVAGGVSHKHPQSCLLFWPPDFVFPWHPQLPSPSSSCLNSLWISGLLRLIFRICYSYCLIVLVVFQILLHCLPTLQQWLRMSFIRLLHKWLTW